MSLQKLLPIVLLTLSGWVYGAVDKKVTVSGTVKDSETGEALIGSVIVLQPAGGGTQAATVTNAYGFYSLSVEPGEYTFKVSYLGYITAEENLMLSENVKKEIELRPETVQTEEVVITTDRPGDNVNKLEMSVNKIDMKTIEKMPALLGEVDVIRSIQLLPGVSTVGEGATGFNVRGGGIDQNLVLLDEAPVYNSSHLFGFFSVFNPDAVKDVKLIKGGIPAQYGGRLSSILDVRMKEGNSKKFAGAGGVGLIFSRLTLEAPIVKDKGSFIIAARRSYADVLARPFLPENLEGTKFYFYDLTAKANYQINEKNKVFLSGYFGRDVFGADFRFNWGNATTTARWNHVFNQRLFFNLTAFYSNYDYSLGVDADGDGFKWRASIVNYSASPEFTYYINSKNTLTFGLKALYYQFTPADAEVKSDGVSRSLDIDKKYALENGAYIGNEQIISPRVSVAYGLRLSSFTYLGAGPVYELADTTLGIRPRVSDTVQAGDWENVKTYMNPEPRFSVKYQLNDKSSIKASYNRMFQYIHLISNTTASTPLDVWTPSSNNIKPQQADQVAAGYFRNIGPANEYEFSVEAYYKETQNQLDYIPDARLLFTAAIEGEVLVGKGRAYGAEFYFKRNVGKLNGWISYTLAKSELQVNGINNNNWYPTRFDKRHNFSAVLLYELNKRWEFSSNITFATGTPANIPATRYVIDEKVLPHNPSEERNAGRVPNYFRLDLAATLHPKGNLNRRWQGEWVFSVYNATNRKNAFSVYARVNADNPNVTEAVRYSVFATIVPGITYNFKF